MSADKPTASSAYSDLVEEAGLQSFPASDPPSWTLGLDRVDPHQARARSSHLSDEQLALLKLILERMRDLILTRNGGSAPYDQAQLGEVLCALQKMQRGSYGLSEGSGRPLPFAWLVLLPWVRFAAEEL